MPARRKIIVAIAIILLGIGTVPLLSYCATLIEKWQLGMEGKLAEIYESVYEQQLDQIKQKGEIPPEVKNRVNQAQFSTIREAILSKD